MKSSFEYKYLSICDKPPSTSHNNSIPRDAAVLIIPKKKRKNKYEKILQHCSIKIDKKQNITKKCLLTKSFEIKGNKEKINNRVLYFYKAIYFHLQ